MNKVIKDIAKNALVFALVGVALAVIVAPLVATLGPEILGEAGMKAALAHTESVAWMGMFFGGLGAAHAAIAPAVDYLFGDKQPAEAPKMEIAAREPAPQICAAVGQVVAPDMSADYRAKLSAERQAAPSQQLS